MKNYSIKPKVSVVIPVYNTYPFLRQCLDSVVNQTLKELEIIIVNDGSPDNSINIIKEYAERDKRIIVIDQPNGGVGNAINNGIAIATGEYLAELDSDDYVDINMYEELYAVVTAHDLDIAISNYRWFTINGDKMETWQGGFLSSNHWYNVVLSAKEHFEHDVFDKRALCYTWTSLYRTTFLHDNNIRWNEKARAYNDNGFWIQTRTLAKRLMYINKTYYNYRSDNPGSSVKNFNKFSQDLLWEFKFIAEYITKNDLWDMVKTHYVINWMRNILYFILPNLPQEQFRKYITEAQNILKICPNNNDIVKDDFSYEHEWILFNKILFNLFAFICASKLTRDHHELIKRINIIERFQNHKPTEAIKNA